MSEKALFTLNDFHFNRILLDIDNLSSNVPLNLNFAPSGVYDQLKNKFTLSLTFKATENDKDVISVSCVAEFEFEDKLDFDAIPDFFYSNSIAILFPYIRAMVSTVTLQANVRPMILPTLNLSSLKDTLKENSKVLNG